MLSIDGLITGIDTETIVEGLLEIQQRQIDVLEGRQQTVIARQTAFRTIEANLLSLRTEAGRLTRIQSGVFDARSVTVSDEDAVLSTASSRAAVGVYQIRINTLAQAHQVASQGFADEDAAITQGTITLRAGDGSPVDITIDVSNDTLRGLADAINTSGAGVAATIIQDGSTSGTPYRLLLTSEETGIEHAISITNNLAASSGDAIRPDFDVDNPVQEAADASVTLGSGAGAITVQNGTNEISDLILGVTLHLRQADPAKTVTVSVNPDPEAATEAVRGFVDAFNAFADFMNEQSQFNAESHEDGLLLGNRNAIGLLDTIRAAVLDSVPGVNPAANRLTAIGVTVGDTGRLVFNETRLQDALNGRLNDISASDVRRLFTLDGVSTNGSIQFLLGSTRTQASQTPYEVDITQAPERASITATNALAASIVIDGTNDTLALTVDGASSTAMTLTQGTYTPEELTDHLESVINANADLAGRSVSVGLEGDQLVITSDSYGSGSQVSVGAGTANTALGLAGTETDAGQDVAGTFLVDGVSEPATGRGRLLVGDLDNEHTADLQLRVTLTPTDVQSGPEAEIFVTRGLAARLDQVLDSFLDPVEGRLKTIDDSFDKTLESLQQSLDRQNAEFERQREAIVQQFIALETAISELQTTSNFLAAQLAGLGNLGSGFSS